MNKFSNRNKIKPLNIQRRHLTSSQKAVVAIDLLPYIEKEANERMSQGGGNKKSGKGKVPDPIEGQGQARDKAAKMTGANPHYVSGAVNIL